MPNSHNKTRGEQRFAAVTYSKLAEWTGLSLHTVRKYATDGAFDRHNLESVLAWVNGRRAAKGLPPIGQAITGLDFNSPDVPMVNRTQEYKPIPIAPPASGGYNPLTGEYDNG